MRIFAILFLLLGTAGAASAVELTLSPDEEQAAVENAEWLMGRRPQPSASLTESLESVSDHEHGVKCGTPLTLDYSLLLSQRSASPATSMLGPRPDYLDQIYDTPGGHFKIHYTKTGPNAVFRSDVDSDGNGVPDFIESMALIADSVHQRIVNGMGYPSPPVDSFYPEGGDYRYDIYVRNLPSTIYGQTWIDSAGLGSTGLLATSFMELDNDYQSISTYRGRELDAVRVTVAHEYFHAVQFAIDYLEAVFRSGEIPARYWMEMSSVWMEEVLYDNINDYYSYLANFYNQPMTSIESFANAFDLHPYASAVFPIFLDEYFGDSTIIRNIWLLCGDPSAGAGFGGGPSFLLAAQRVIDSISGGQENWATVFREFALWNYYTGSRAALAPDSVGFSERAYYPAIPDDSIAWHVDYPFSVLANDNLYRPQNNAAAYIELDEMTSIANRYWTCDSGSFSDTTCTDSSFTLDSTQGYERIDSLMSFRIAYRDSGYVRPWGLNIVYRPVGSPNTTIVDRVMLPVLGFNNAAWINVPNPRQYSSITMIVSWASEDWSKYASAPDSGASYAYRVPESVLIDSLYVNVPSAVLSPFPNPAVVADMADGNVTFRFQVETNESTFPLFDAPRMIVDVFNIAGEYITTLDSTVTGVDVQRFGQYDLMWNMTNAAGSDVASGTYLAYARLFSDNSKEQLLAEDKAKVLIVR